MNSIINKYSYVIDTFILDRSIERTARNTGVSSSIIRKILITAGLWENNTSKQIEEIRKKHPDWSNARIANQLHITSQLVNMYSPYKGNDIVETDNNKNDDNLIVDGGICGDDAEWSLTYGGKLTISGTGEMFGYGGDYCRVFNSDRPAWWRRKDNIYVKEIVVEEGITAIGQYSFSFLDNLRSVSLPSTLTDIQGGAFAGINRLKEIHIPDLVKVISWDLFFRCIYLESVYIPSGIEKIQGYAFHACANLKHIYFYGPPPSIVTETAFYLGRKDTVIHYKDSNSGWNNTWCGYRTEKW